MTSRMVESLQSRDMFASVSVDSDYQFSQADLSKTLGQNAIVYQAEPAANGRTYLLAARKVRVPVDDRSHLVNYLTVIAVNAAGTLDSTFSGDGIAPTGRQFDKMPDALLPGIMRIDPSGRIYFADATRVMRFKANGTNDTSFGTNGVITYATNDKPTQLCDMTVSGDGVLLATYSVKRNAQHFAVEKVDGRTSVQTWEAKHDSKVAYDVDGKIYSVNSNIAQFASSRGRVVLARLESDGAVYESKVVGSEGDTLAGSARQDVVVTRFDADGVGTDLVRREAKRSGKKEYDSQPVITILGHNDPGLTAPVGGNVLLSGNGRIMTVQTDQEILRFDLRAASAKRQTLPGRVARPGSGGNFQLLPGSDFVLWDSSVNRRGRGIVNVQHFSADGVLDTSFGDNGTLVLGGDAFASTGDKVIDQMFLDSAGRLNFLASGRYLDRTSGLTVGRLA